MGVGGNFWDLLKPYSRHYCASHFYNKRIAVDLSYWIVQHDAAIRAKSPHVRSPHIRITFYRTIALFGKMGVYPVFVVDGDPSPLKGKARMERFLRGSGVDFSDLEAGTSKRNGVFARYIRECVELLELLGMPIIEARSEAEALCAQLNREGHVDACMTADSDAFLFGAKCVIKCFKSNSKDPFECYYMSDIETCLGLRRKQIVAIALLVGNDHDLGGVPGFGVDIAVRFAKLFTEDEILDRLSEIGQGGFPLRHNNNNASRNLHVSSLDKSSSTLRSPHCSHCGHPGNKREHLKHACAYCSVNGFQNCIEKLKGFICQCPTCKKDLEDKEQRRHENWLIKVCNKITKENNFPNKEIINIYLCDSHEKWSENDGPALTWNKPNVEFLVDFLTYHQQWQPSYIRQKLLPILSTIFFREVASKPNESLLLNDQYKFHSVLRVKIRYGNPYYLIKWKRVGFATKVNTSDTSANALLDTEESGLMEPRENLLDEPDVPEILVEDGCWYLLTVENMELVQAAYPGSAEQFLDKKRMKELKMKQKQPCKIEIESGDKCETPKSVQLSITQFYRSTKSKDRPMLSKCPGHSLLIEAKKGRKLSDDLDHPIPKSVRRRLLFD